jgi:hypothetical protein
MQAARYVLVSAPWIQWGDPRSKQKNSRSTKINVLPCSSIDMSNKTVNLSGDKRDIAQNTSMNRVDQTMVEVKFSRRLVDQNCELY